MSKWTLRGSNPRFKIRGKRQDHPAVLRAHRYVRRHAWQFHGTGVMDAVAQLEATGGARQGAGSLSAREVRAALGFSLPDIGAVTAVREALDELAVPLYLPGPLTLSYDDYPESAVCLCTHPYAQHNVNGLCIALPGVLGCGCMGWLEVRSERLDPDDDGTDACGHGDNPDETCEGCYG